MKFLVSRGTIVNLFQTMLCERHIFNNHMPLYIGLSMDGELIPLESGELYITSVTFVVYTVPRLILLSVRPSGPLSKVALRALS